MITVELHGLEVFGYHGVEEAERRDGQPFYFDVRLRVAEPDGDRIENAVDYREVAAAVLRVSDSRSFQLLETLAAAAADELMASFPLEGVTVRVRKRPADLPVEHSAATVERP